MPLELTPDLEQFLQEHISSTEDLSILGALVESESRWWDARAMAAHVGGVERETRRVLERFASRNLLDIRITDDVRYQLRPGTDALAHAIAEFSTSYRRSAGALFAWISQRRRRSVSDFADAFKIKRT